MKKKYFLTQNVSNRSTQITSSDSLKNMSMPSSNKKTSRISLKVSQIENSQIIKEYDEIYKNESQSDNYCDDVDLFKDIPLEINIVLHFDQDKIKTFSLSISSAKSVNDLINKVIDDFNRDDYEIVLKKNKFSVKLVNNPNLYYIKPAKKNKLPKTDYPPFNSKLPLSDLYTHKLSFLAKENANCVEFTKIRDINKSNCKKCLIF